MCCDAGRESEDSPSQGTLQISVGYLLDKQALEVSVIQAKLPTKSKQKYWLKPQLHLLAHMLLPQEQQLNFFFLSCSKALHKC